MEDTLYELFGFYESDRFVRVSDQSYYKMCAHPKPQRVSFIDHEFVPTRPQINKYAVPLSQFMNHNGIIGYAGQCKVCGKVYYR